MLLLEKPQIESEPHIPGACHLVEGRVNYLLSNLNHRYLPSSICDSEIILKTGGATIKLAEFGTELPLKIHHQLNEYLKLSPTTYPELFYEEHLKSAAYFIKNPTNNNLVTQLSYQSWDRSKIGEHNMVVKLHGSRHLWIAVPENPNIQDNYQIVRRFNDEFGIMSKLKGLFEI